MKWLKNLWGHEQWLKYPQRNQVIDKPNSDEIVLDNALVRFSLLPKKWTDKSFTKRSLLLKQDEYGMRKYFKTKKWKEFLVYTFHDIRGDHASFDLINLKTQIEWMRESMVIVVIGRVKMHVGARNRVYFSEVYDQITDALYKSTEEGETIVKDVGQLTMGIDTHMLLEYAEF
jgi:hypothetical protein